MTPYIRTQDKKLCCGCTACAAICEHKAISMQEDYEGFLFPVLDNDLCVNCGLCDKVCPMGSDHQANSGQDQKSYLAISEHPEHYCQSATIGICTILARLFVENGGKVFGVSLDESTWKTTHICVSDNEGVERLRNSKYIQSNLQQTFSEAKDFLKNGFKVLFIGTPCQIAGLKAYLHHDFENLLTIDLICHGIYSYKLIRKEVEYWEERLHGKVSNFKFRSKRRSGGVINFDLKTILGTKHYEFFGPFSPTYRCFAYNGDNVSYNLRHSCYCCPFRGSSRYGDITVGDAWFIDAAKYLNIEIDWKNGVSHFFGNTQKGNDYIHQILPLLKWCEIPLEEGFKQPAILPTHREIPSERKQLYKAINTSENYAQIIKRLLHVDVEQLYDEVLRKERNTEMKNFVKRVLLINKFRSIKSKLKPGWEWWFTNSFLYNFPSKRFRNYMLRKMGMTFEGDARIYAGFHIRNPKGIVLGKGVSIGPKALLDGRKGLTIEEGAVIGYGAIIWTLNHDYNDIHFCGKGAPVTIGRRAWICSNSIILPGITVGEGAVVASGAVVTHDVEPYTIVGGIPAKVIGKRAEKEYDYLYRADKDSLHFC
ncbi:MAG: Coenzyme F420 hydrogenase/dehydrogenase, beta subunit C-terminal domain [Paludibacteraceae bacterium]|nr:Coenzyme F420 hydrogenase/dehydrogenase, beta subunit C-terminal domain [Paludibacteraceae bacterium]